MEVQISEILGRTTTIHNKVECGGQQEEYRSLGVQGRIQRIVSVSIINLNSKIPSAWCTL